jgi:hypothetical protein
MAIDNGPATGSAELFLGTPPTCGVEVHVPSGVNPLTPLETANSVRANVGTSLTAQTKKDLNLGGAGIRFLSPA